jgi:hypothetical protein
MKKLLSLLISVIALITIDYAIPFKYSLLNKDDYLLGFDSFLKSAVQTRGQDRIILVGGSSLGWGISAERLTKRLGILTLNSGIHAGVGYRNFFRNISDVIDKNRDIIVISPEYSLVSQDADLGRSDEFCAISIYVRGDYPIDCVGYSINSLIKIYPILNARKTMTYQDEYIKQGFNEFGDYTHRVTVVSEIGENVYDDRCSGWSIDDLSEKYIPFIDNFISKGYEVVYLPNFIPSIECSDFEKVRKFHTVMFDRYGIPSFRNAQLFFSEEYFYNSGYHLSDEGVSLKTRIYEEQLRHYLELR